MSGMSLVEMFILAGVISSSSTEIVLDEEVAVGVVFTGADETSAGGSARKRNDVFPCNKIIVHIHIKQI